jgi:hypothetical protein
MVVAFTTGAWRTLRPRSQKTRAQVAAVALVIALLAFFHDAVATAGRIRCRHIHAEGLECRRGAGGGLCG